MLTPVFDWASSDLIVLKALSKVLEPSVVLAGPRQRQAQHKTAIDPHD